MWPLDFISEKDFTNHVKATIEQYGINLEPYDLKKFNSNIVDPIKLIFDKTVYRLEWDQIIRDEIFRQRDKSSNNDIGYFHQKIFKNFDSCTVPDEGWDVVFKRESGIEMPDGDRVRTIYVEMKNKHNTMNSSAGSKTYMKMQGQLLSDDDCACLLVEAIARRSQNITWQVSIDGTKQKHRRIRRVSMDEFYRLVTGQSDAFYQMCMVLPSVIKSVVAGIASSIVPTDTVINELNQLSQEKYGSFVLALYMLGFSTYLGFYELVSNAVTHGFSELASHAVIHGFC